MRRVLRWVVGAADGEWHEVEARGPLLGVTGGHGRNVVVQVMDDESCPAVRYQVRALRTGEFDAAGDYLGTVRVTGEDLHLFARERP